MAKISIVVPIYNSERHLEECLNSILNQTFQDYEVICVEDASEDASGRILFEFQKRDSRISVLSHKVRQGAGNTRNHGLEYAKAPYVVFWDADEIYVSDLLEKMYDSVLKFDADVVLAERGIIRPQLNCVIPEGSIQYEGEGYDKAAFTIMDLPYTGLNMWPSSPVNRMVKRQFIEDNFLRYQDLQSSNDVLFADMVMLLAERIIHISDWKPKIYVRRNIPGSISVNRDPFCSFQAFKEIKRQLSEKNSWDKYKIYVINQFILTIKGELSRCNDENKRKKYYKFVKEEGIKSICGKEEVEYILFHSQAGIFLDNLLKSPYEKRIWEKTMLWMQLEDNKVRMIELIQYFKKNYLNVTLWGAGKWGADLITYCKKELSFEFDFLVDNNKDLVGSYVAEKKISSFMEVKDKTDLIVITNINYKRDILQQVKSANPKLKIFSLPQYLGDSIIQCIE